MSTIITRNSATSGSIPSSLVQGELAINVTNNRLFFGSGSGNNVKEFGVSSSYALSASYAQTASYLNTLNQDLTFNGNLTLNGTASIAFLNVTYESASVIYSSGSNQFGDASNDVQTLWGTVDVKTGPVLVTGSVNASSGFTGSLLGTASYAAQALSSSYALTASYVNPLNQTVEITGSLQVQNSIDSSLRFLFDSTGTASLDWEDGYLYNGSGSISADWKDRKLYDSNVDNSVDWNSRQLFKSDGTTVTLNWETGAFTGSMLGTASYAAQALTASYATTASYTPSIAGTDNYIPKFNGSSALENSVMYESSSNIGIGTISPSYKLDINGTFRSNGIWTDGSAVTSWGIGSSAISYGILTWGSGYATVCSATGNVLHLAANGSSPDVTIDTSGNVGIGTTTAYTTGGTSKLSIAGTVFSFGASNTDLSYFRSLGSGIAQWQTYNSANTGEIHLQPYGGDVLIGNTTNAGYRLDVNGSMRAGSSNQSLIFTPTAGSPILEQNGSTGSRVRASSGTRLLQLESYAGDANYLTATGAGLWIRTTDSNTIYFRTNNITAGQISTNQNWSIGSIIDAGYRLDVSGSTRFNGNSIITGSLNVTGGITGSLLGTASYATQALSSSYAVTASYVQNAQTASYVLQAVSASYATTASYVQNAQTASYVLQAVSASYATTSSYVNPLKQTVQVTGSLLVTGSVYINNALYSNQTTTLATENKVVYSVPTATYNAMFVDYVVINGSNVRAGQIVSATDGTNKTYTETTTTDIGSTTPVTFNVSILGGNFQLEASASTSTWTVKTTTRVL